MSKIDEILANDRELLKEKPKNFVKQVLLDEDAEWRAFVRDPNRTESKVFQVLVPEDFEWKDVIVNWYLGEKNLSRLVCIDMLGVEVLATYIVHGHGRNSTCSTPTQCH